MTTLQYIEAYGVVLALVTGIAAASRDGPIRDNMLLKLQAVAAAHWIAYNIVTLRFGWDSGVALVCLSSLGAIVSAWVGFYAKSWVALGVVLLWLAGALLTTGFYYFRMQTMPLHYLCLNITFIGRMLLVGGAGVVEMVRRTRDLPLGSRARVHLG